MVLPVPPVQSFSLLAVEPSLPALVAGLRSFHDEGAGEFNYDPFRGTLVDYLARRCGIEGARQYCRTRGAKAGRRQNVEAVDTAFPFLASRIGFSTKIKRDYYGFRQDLSINVGPLIVTRDKSTPVLVTTQPRKRWQMSEEAWRLWATIVARTHAGDDSLLMFEDLDEPVIEILDLSAREGDAGRQAISHRFQPDELMSEFEFMACLQRFADAHDMLVAEGFVPKRKKRSQRPSDQPDMFDPLD